MTKQEYDAVAKVMVDCDSHPVIFDIGAYCGEDEPEFRKMVYPSELFLLMVEPDPRNIAIIETKPFGPMRHLVRGAVAACDGAKHFRFSYDSRDGSRGSGSLLEPTGHLEHFPTITFAESATVPCYMLDTLFKHFKRPKIDLLWVDVQGAEADMIVGGRLALAHTRYLFMEAEEIEMYSGQALKAELIDMLSGWQLIEDFGYNILLKNNKFAEVKP